MSCGVIDDVDVDVSRDKRIWSICVMVRNSRTAASASSTLSLLLLLL